jgi:hypothetical protein
MHVVFIPKYRKKTLYGKRRRRSGDELRTLAKQKESHVIEGDLIAGAGAHADLDRAEEVGRMSGPGLSRLGQLPM